jgi:FkbM family methyltransferase
MKEKTIISYAQNREDVILDAFFDDGHRGFYVDIGASDPEKYSVTKHFYDNGWSGINVEPNNALAKKLSKARRRDITLNIALSDKPGRAVFRQYAADGLSTLSSKTKKRLANKEIAAEYQDLEVEVSTLAKVLKMHASDKPISFMKIDVEGYEYEVLRGNDWSTYRPRVLCIEADKIERDWPSLLSSANYEKVYNDGLNDYYVDKTNEPVFDYLHRVIGRRIHPASTIHTEEKLNELEIKQMHNESEISRLQRVIATKDEEINYLHQHIAELNRFKNMVKNLAVKVHTIIDLRLTNQFKKKKLYPRIPIDITRGSVDELLVAVQQADHDVFYRRPTLKEVIKMSSAKILHRTYKISARVVKRSAKAAKRAIERGRK